MQHRTRALAYALAILAAAEVGLRVLDVDLDPDVAATPAAEVHAEAPVVILVGSSRTQRAVVPHVVEEYLAEAGLADAFVASLHRPGATQAGLYKIYLELVRPHVTASELTRGFVGIEVRVSGANDNFLMDIEREYVATLDLGAEDAGSGADALNAGAPTADAESTDGPAASAGAAPSGFLELARSGDLDAAAGRLLGRLELARLRETVVRPLSRRWSEPEPAPAASDASPPPANPFRDALVEADVTWALGGQGWRAFDEARRRDLQFDLMRGRYVDKYLLDFELGGLQTELLRRLVQQVRADGLTPFLYVLPVSPMHARFYRGGLRERFLEQTEALAREENVPLYDLGADSGLKNRHFQDTHHMLSQQAPVFSQRFAEVVRALIVGGGEDGGD